MKGAVFAEKAVWRGATRENILGGSSTEESTKPDGLFRENPSGGGSFARGLRWIGRHGLLQGCSGLAALAMAKIPRRSALQNFQTGSYANHFRRGAWAYVSGSAGKSELEVSSEFNHGWTRMRTDENPKAEIRKKPEVRIRYIRKRKKRSPGCGVPRSMISVLPSRSPTEAGRCSMFCQGYAKALPRVGTLTEGPSLLVCQGCQGCQGF